MAANTQGPAATNVAKDLEIDSIYKINVTGFNYIKDYAIIKGTVADNNESVSVIIGDKQSFGMRDMFELKNADHIKAKYRKDRVVNNVTYKSFQLEEIAFG